MSGTRERGLSDESDRRIRLRRADDASLRDAVEQLRNDARRAERVALEGRKLLEDLGVEALGMSQRALLPEVLSDFEIRKRERVAAREHRVVEDRRTNRSLAIAAFVVSVITVAAPYVHDIIINHHP